MQANGVDFLQYLNTQVNHTEIMTKYLFEFMQKIFDYLTIGFFLNCSDGKSKQ